MKYISSHTEFILEASERWLDTGRVKPQQSYNQWSKIPDPGPDGKYNDQLRIDNTLKYEILKFIYKGGLTGVSYTDILRHVFKTHRNKEYNYKEDRGYYSGLISGTTGIKGILPTYCKKNDNKKWVLDNNILVDHFNDLKEEGILDVPYVEHKAKELGIEDDVELFREWGILGDVVNKKY